MALPVNPDSSKGWWTGFCGPRATGLSFRTLCWSPVSSSPSSPSVSLLRASTCRYSPGVRSSSLQALPASIQFFLRSVLKCLSSEKASVTSTIHSRSLCWTFLQYFLLVLTALSECITNTLLFRRMTVCQPQHRAEPTAGPQHRPEP